LGFGNRISAWQKGNAALALQKIWELLQRYEPSVLVVEECAHRMARRTARIARLTEQMLAVARTQGVPTRRFQFQGIKESIGLERGSPALAGCCSARRSEKQES
jgi:hypothetical protein